MNANAHSTMITPNDSAPLGCEWCLHDFSNDVASLSSIPKENILHNTFMFIAPELRLYQTRTLSLRTNRT